MGLDFGTTNSAMALSEQNSVSVVNIGNGGTNDRTLRSILFFDKNRDIQVGQAAIAQYIKSGGSNCRLLQSIKTFLPDSGFTDTTIFRKNFKIEDLVSLILIEIKRLGEARAGHSIDNVVMGRPVFFSDDQKKDKLAENRLKNAALQSGFKDVSFEYEPIAATLAYLDKMGDKNEETVLMCDIGGGTSDFTIMRLSRNMPKTQEEKKKRILSMGGVYIGGDSFDSHIMWEKGTPHFGKNIIWQEPHGPALDMPTSIMRTICDCHMIPFLRDQKILEGIRLIKNAADKPQLVENLEHLIRDNKGFAVFQEVERVKSRLSAQYETVFSFSDKNIHFTDQISRVEFESYLARDIMNISSCVSKTILDAGIESKGIDKVLLTGGSSLVPAIRRIFCEMFGEQKIVNLDAFTSVAHGLATSALFEK